MLRFGFSRCLCDCTDVRGINNDTFAVSRSGKGCGGQQALASLAKP